ncbi:MAG: hypothetical protein GKR91_15225 [Pseudomonadales bacterium]|nr:hypothetical protein [Pseudomonadales bacterium]
MNIFDLLAEWNITKWLKEPKNNETVEGRTEESAGDGKTNFGKAYESHLLDDIKLLISNAYRQTDEERRNELLRQARDIETQLIMSYEKQGYNLLAVNTQEQIREHERKLTSAEGNS